jgi:hypothetical protein
LINKVRKLLTTLLTKPVRAAFITLLMLFSVAASGQELTPVPPDSIPSLSDTIRPDTSDIRKEISKQALKDEIDYKCSDSIIFNINEDKVYLYHDVEIKYQSITLKAAYVEIDFRKNTLFAKGMNDSTGKEFGKPVFADGGQSFASESIWYNFNTKKGIIRDVITNEGDSYLHGSLVKRYPDNTTHVKDGKYTTCSHAHPHYEIRFFRAKVIPDDKIVSGPAYLVIEDVPTPAFIPFGFFPNKRGQTSGILIPTYGESANRGFFFENGGYYWGINDYVDLALRGDIYTRGSWAVKAASNYKKRYKYEGSIDLSYAVNILGEREMPGYEKIRDFFIKWQHRQDPRARPNSSFSANVNAGSSSYNRFNPTSANDYLSNDFESSIAYQTSFGQGRYNLSTNVGYKQNVNTHEVLLRAPQLNFSVNTFYPFRNKNKPSFNKWYDNISLSYVMNAQNLLNTVDSTLFTARSLDLMQNGMQHSIPLKSTLKLLKFFTLTTTLQFNERWYLSSIRKNWEYDTTGGRILTDTLKNFASNRDFNIGTSLSTRIYGMYQFKKGPVLAIRHVITPTVSATYRPDFGTPFWGYYRFTTIDTLGNKLKYSIFENGIYGGPPDGESGKIAMSLSNNLEMKVRARKDSAGGSKKVVLIDNLTISGAYDVARDSLNWDPLGISARTRLFRRLDITFNGSWDPYVIDTNGNRFNRFEWTENGRLFRRSNTQWMFGLSWSFSSNDFKRGGKGTSGETPPQHPAAQVDYSNPWNISIGYNLTYSSRFDFRTRTYIPDTIQTLQVSGDFNITPKWKAGITTGYDFNAKDFSYTSVNIYRDLHCWEMVLQWIPLGFRKSYNFTIRVKSAILQDLKLNKKTDWRDYY